jgi:serine/threonine-protein kinase
LLAAALTAVLLRTREPGALGASTPVRLAVRLPAGVRLDLETNIGETALLAISPDGTKLAFVASDGAVRRLYLRSLGSFDALAVPGSEEASAPFFSPDGQWVAFAASGSLFKAPVAGGAPIDLCPAEVGRGGAWGPDGTIVFTAGIASGLMRVSSSGGRPEALTELDPANHERTHRWPTFLRGGHEVVYVVGLEGKSTNYDDSEVDAVSLATGKKRHLGLQASFVRATEDGSLLFARQGRISSVRLDALGGSRAPEPVVVLQGVAGVQASGVAHFDVSQNGTLVYAEADPHAGEGELAWVSRDGRTERLALPARGYSMPAVSADGTKLAVRIRTSPGVEDIWVHDLRLGSIANLSADGASQAPVWNPLGSRVTYTSKASAPARILARSTDGRGPPELVRTCRDDAEAPQSWTPDEKELVCLIDSGPPNSADLLSWSPRDQQSRVIRATEAVEYAGILSPDGRWIALGSIETGRNEIWVQAFPDDGGRWQVTESGAMPCWSRDGTELFFVDGQNLMSVRVKTEPSFAATPPVKLFALEFPTSSDTVRNWDVAPDGRFLVVLRTSKETLAGHVNVVQNWLGERR